MNNKYSISEFFTTAYSFMLTKIFFKKARLIRRPFYLRGAKSFSYDSGLTLGHACRIDLKGDSKKRLIIGKDCEIGDYVHLVAHENVTIGDNVLIASKVFISDTSHGNYSSTSQDSPMTKPNSRELFSKPVLIESNVWIGENVVILPGVEIGKGAIIGANSTVSKSIPANSIAIGSPAKVIKKFNFKKEMWEKIGDF
ncbi:DapH/DapD/GlmU-related protein [Streptococcus iniae]|uniref:DapH/DapD/GlmU-related protein n=1 Tax=Streptococcus iniae TaxID=1346 RepID=UPI002877B08E|nr:DapH/DapD/GlmU-related protein [Streptococcus iniae]